MNWYTSDWHLGHKSVINFENRPFEDLEQMAEVLIDNWNSVVGEKDVGYFAGDMTFLGTDKTRSYIERLNGFKILLRGNHDPKHGTCLNMGFDFVTNNGFVKIGNNSYYISHYPFNDDRFPDRSPVDHGQRIIHGHTHSSEVFNGKQIHVGVDACDFKPMSDKMIMEV